MVKLLHCLTSVSFVKQTFSMVRAKVNFKALQVAFLERQTLQISKMLLKEHTIQSQQRVQTQSRQPFVRSDNPLYGGAKFQGW